MLRSPITIFIKTKPVALLVMVSVVPWLALQLAISIYMEVFFTSSKERGTALESLRLIMWSELFLALKSQPLWGFGWGQVSMAVTSLSDSPYEFGRVMKDGHNFILNLLIWNGVPLGAFAIAVGGMNIWSLRLWQKKVSLTRWFATAVVGCVVLHGLTGRVISYSYVLLPLFFLVGYLGCTEVQRTYMFVRSRALFVFVLAFGVSLVSYFISYLKVEEDARAVAFQSRGFESGVSVPYIRQKMNGSLLFGAEYSYLYLALVEDDVELSTKELNEIETIARRHPSRSALFKAARIFALGKQCDKAVRFLAMGRRLHGTVRFGYHDEFINSKCTAN